MAGTKEGWVVWQSEGDAFEGRTGSGYSFPVDDKPAAEGGTGPSPMELVLVAVAGCTAMDVVSILLKKRQQVTGVQVRARGTRAHDNPRVYTHITVEYVVKGRGVSPAAVKAAIELSEEKYCSVMAMLRPGVEVSIASRVEEQES